MPWICECEYHKELGQKPNKSEVKRKKSRRIERNNMSRKFPPPALPLSSTAKQSSRCSAGNMQFKE
uniref:Uncharacterized protein n=1 Tax=Glossina palpalis gambiensis TaxID=67801 RepID=A0A1B0BHX1_9MUSC